MVADTPLGKRRLNLALQGGGAHGAFTWGVLDALLEDAALEIGWVSGTSAGAVNAVALASGLVSGGREGARASLARVWQAVVSAAVPDAVKLNPLLAVPWESMARSGTLAQMATLFSPYDINPFGIDPLRQLLEAEIDFASLRRASGPELLIAATNIESGRARLFRRHEMTIDAVIASACLPSIHHAVEIDGDAYWDGGFSANPDLATMAAESPIEDTLIVQLGPILVRARPTSARDIAAHVSHLAFNRPYVEALDEVVRLQARARAAGRLRSWFGLHDAAARRELRIGRHRFHLIDASRFTAGLSHASKGKPDETMVGRLFRAGRDETAKWLERHRGQIGVVDTADLAQRVGRD